MDIESDEDVDKTNKIIRIKHLMLWIHSSSFLSAVVHSMMQNYETPHIKWLPKKKMREDIAKWIHIQDMFKMTSASRPTVYIFIL